MPYVAEEVRFNAAIDHSAPDFADRLAASCPDGGSKSILRNVGGAIWHAVMALLKGFARVPVCRLIARSGAMGQADGPNLLPVTLREVLRMSLMSIGVEL
jgi:NADPH-dependent curcumin reductase CurA